MFNESAGVYDLIYSAVKDYQAESGKLAALIRQLAPRARTILDVACGTGSHAAVLSGDHGFEVDGVDLEPGLLEIARAKHASGRFVQADMTAFQLGRSYDVVMCLFSSIAYAAHADGVVAALRCMRDHLNPDGLVLVEPWFTPEQWNVGRVGVNVVESKEISVVRMSHASVRARVSVLTLDYLIGTAAAGVRHAREVHELGLFTRAEMEECFRRAGLASEYDPVGPMGRGLYVAKAVA